MEDVVKLHAAWCKSLQQAVETDAWGQVVEAVEAYERLAGRITKAIPVCKHLTAPQKASLYFIAESLAVLTQKFVQDVIEKVVVALEMRAKCLSSVDGQRKPTKEDMEDVLDALRGALSDEPEVFPLDVTRAMRSKTRESVKKEVDEIDDGGAAELVDATSQVAVLRSPGATYLDIRITKIGLKDASVYVNPTMAVSVFDYSGKAMEETRETGAGTCSEPRHVTFNANIQLATNLRKLEDHGGAITFEFFHYKAKKRKKSCRCWALLELDEIKDGPVVLELYQKPMDPKRKRIHLFTEKELYLQLELRLQKL